MLFYLNFEILCDLLYGYLGEGEVIEGEREGFGFLIGIVEECYGMCVFFWSYFLCMFKWKCLMKFLSCDGWWWIVGISGVWFVWVDWWVLWEKFFFCYWKKYCLLIGKMVIYFVGYGFENRVRMFIKKGFWLF